MDWSIVLNTTKVWRRIKKLRRDSSGLRSMNAGTTYVFDAYLVLNKYLWKEQTDVQSGFTPKDTYSFCSSMYSSCLYKALFIIQKVAHVRYGYLSGFQKMDIMLM